MTTTQTDEIKTWQQRLEETCPALGPMHIHACVEEVNDAMQAEIAELRSALQSAQPVAQPLTDEQIDAFWNQQLTVPQIVQRRVIARAIEAAHGIGGAL